MHPDLPSPFHTRERASPMSEGACFEENSVRIGSVGVGGGPRQSGSALSGRKILGSPHPWLTPRRLSSAAPAPSYAIEALRGWDRRSDRSRQKETPKDGVGRIGEEAQNKAAARDATAVSTVHGRRRSCNFVGRQKLVEGAPVSRMPICGRRARAKIQHKTRRLDA